MRFLINMFVPEIPLILNGCSTTGPIKLSIDITCKAFLMSGKQHLLVPFHVDIQLKNPSKGVEA